MSFKRALGPFDATMVVIGGIIGSGIFINPYLVARQLDSARRVQRPEWERFRDPWEFYSPAVIESRQERWKEEEARRSEDDLEDDELFAEEPALPYVRETPKVGRNDPCPCGSGKKYKKCCLSA